MQHSNAADQPTNPSHDNYKVTKCINQLQDGRVKVEVKVEARGTQEELGQTFLAKDGLLYVDKRPDGLGIRERRVVKVQEKKNQF